MLKPVRCDFLTGSLTGQASMDGLTDALDKQIAGVHENLFYKKNSSAIWLEVTTQHCILHTLCDLIQTFLPEDTFLNCMIILT